MLAAGVEQAAWSLTVSGGGFSDPPAGVVRTDFGVAGLDARYKLTGHWTLTGSGAVMRYLDGYLLGLVSVGTRCEVTGGVAWSLLLSAGDLGSGPTVGLTGRIQLGQ